MKKSKYIIVMLCAALCLLLSGCIMKSVSELYALPVQSAGAEALQTAINHVMPGGAQLSVINNGDNQQPVQMADIDGDGQDEAVVFVLGNGEKPLKIYLFDQVNDKFVNSHVIEAAGVAFDSVQYAQVDGVGGLEIILGRLLRNQSQKELSVYSFRDGQVEEQVSAEYTDYLTADLDQDSNSDIFLVNFKIQNPYGSGMLYHLKDGSIIGEPELPLSFDISGYRNLEIGYLNKNLPGVFVNGIIADKSATAVFTLQNDVFASFTSDGNLGMDAGPVGGYNVFPMDYDQDGVMDFPHVVQISQAVTDPDAPRYQAIIWHRYGADGTPVFETTTYHDFDGNWYLQFPNRIGTQFGIRQSEEIAGTQGMMFYSKQLHESVDELFTVYEFTGTSKNTAVSEHGCFILSVRDDTVFAAKLGVGASYFNLSQEEVVAMFNEIRVSGISAMN